MRIQTGEQDRVVLHALDSSGAGVTGATILLSIRRDSDGMFYTGTGFSTSFTTLTMSEVDSSNLPGVYYYDFTAPIPETGYVLHATSSTSSVANDPWVGQIIAGFWADDIDDSVSSRASSEDMTTALKRIGSSILDLDLKKITGLLDQCLGYLRRL